MGIKRHWRALQHRSEEDPEPGRDCHEVAAGWGTMRPRDAACWCNPPGV